MFFITLLPKPPLPAKRHIGIALHLRAGIFGPIARGVVLKGSFQIFAESRFVEKFRCDEKYEHKNCDRHECRKEDVFVGNEGLCAVVVYYFFGVCEDGLADKGTDDTGEEHL